MRPEGEGDILHCERTSGRVNVHIMLVLERLRAFGLHICNWARLRDTPREEFSIRYTHIHA